MTEKHGRYDRRLPQPHVRPSEPEPLGELLRRFVEERRWSHLLQPASCNGHRPVEGTTVWRRDG